MSVMEFECPPEGHAFARGDVVFVVDKNKVDLWRATVTKVLKNACKVKIEDDDEEEQVKPTRLLTSSDVNNTIFTAQAAKRAKIAEEKRKPEQDDREDDTQDDDRGKVRKPRKAKKPVLSGQAIVRDAWGNGIHDVDGFRKFMTENMDAAMKEFESFHRMMNVSEYPLFKLGEASEDQTKEFWTQALNHWKKLFGDEEAVDAKLFVKRLAAEMRLPNQSETNAREILMWFFDAESDQSIAFAQFCAFLAMFGPVETAIRKVGHFLSCPAELRDEVMYVDLEEARDPAVDIEENEVNAFTVMKGTEEITVYNRVHANADAKYLVDQDRQEFDSWNALFESIHPTPKEESQEAAPDPVPEQTTEKKPKAKRSARKQAKKEE